MTMYHGSMNQLQYLQFFVKKIYLNIWSFQGLFIYFILLYLNLSFYYFFKCRKNLYTFVCSKTNFQSNAPISITPILEKLTNHHENSILIPNYKIIEHSKSYERLQEINFSFTHAIIFLLSFNFSQFYAVSHIKVPSIIIKCRIFSKLKFFSESSRMTKDIMKV